MGFHRCDPFFSFGRLTGIAVDLCLKITVNSGF